jgi:hypothetical protein
LNFRRFQVLPESLEVFSRVFDLFVVLLRCSWTSKASEDLIVVWIVDVFIDQMNRHVSETWSFFIFLRSWSWVMNNWDDWWS